MSRITLMSWNVNGIRAVHRKGFLDWFAEAAPDVLCLQETKAHRSQLPEELTDVPGYHAYFAEAERKGYSGVALYSREEPLSVKYGLGIERFDREGRTIVADYGWFVFMGIYFPNGKQSPERLQYKMDFYDAFLEYVDRLRDTGRNVVICGDVNTAHREIDLARPKENASVSGFLPGERAWIDTFLGHGYLDTFRLFNSDGGQYTWWNLITRARERNVGWRIDYFYASEGLRDAVTNAWILPDVMGSDHCPIALELERPE